MNRFEYTKAPSALFEALDQGDLAQVRHLEIVKDYGDHGTHADTGEEVVFFQWEGGGRKLARYLVDGSLFLVQTSEVYEFEEANLQRDWFQVESEEQAEWINTHMDGEQLRFQYRGPHIWTSEEGLRWRRAPEELSGREQLHHEFHE